MSYRLPAGDPTRVEPTNAAYRAVCPACLYTGQPTTKSLAAAAARQHSLGVGHRRALQDHRRAA